MAIVLIWNVLMASQKNYLFMGLVESVSCGITSKIGLVAVIIKVVVAARVMVIAIIIVM